MSKRRMIDPSFWQSESIAQLTLQQRYLFIGLFSNADDQGRLRGHPALIRNAVFPFDEISFDQIKADLQAIAATGSIIIYQVDGKDCIQITGWWDYQKPQWAYPSEIAAPGGWNDRLRYRQNNDVITSNWNGEADSDNGSEPDEPGPELPPNNGNGLPKSLPKALPISLPKAPELEIELGIELNKEDDKERARAKFWTVYQTEIGAISPIISQKFDDYFGKVPLDWMIDSVAIAAENNVRKANYVASCIDSAMAAKMPPRLAKQKNGGTKNGHTKQPIKPKQTISGEPYFDFHTGENVYPDGRRERVAAS